MILMMTFAACNQNESGSKWGITLDAENVSSKGMTLVCHQLGGEDVFELQTGSMYGIQKLENSKWIDITDNNRDWTSEAWTIQTDGTTKWEINWVGYCGELPAGKYRIVKPITNFRGPGDYDTEILCAEFSIN